MTLTDAERRIVRAALRELDATRNLPGGGAEIGRWGGGFRCVAMAGEAHSGISFTA